MNLSRPLSSPQTRARRSIKLGLSGQERRMSTAGASRHTRQLQVQSTWAGEARGEMERLVFICDHSTIFLYACLDPRATNLSPRLSPLLQRTSEAQALTS